MKYSIEINNNRLKRSYRIVVIVAFAVLLTFGAFSQTILSIQSAGCRCCNPCKCPCMQPENHDTNNISGKCKCNLSDTPNIPQLPVGINNQQENNVDTLSCVDKHSTSILLKNNHNTKNKSKDYFTGLKAPPLYLTNSSFLI